MNNTKEIDQIMSILENHLALAGYDVTGGYNNILYVTSKETRNQFCITTDEDVG